MGQNSPWRIWFGGTERTQCVLVRTSSQPTFRSHASGYGPHTLAIMFFAVQPFEPRVNGQVLKFASNSTRQAAVARCRSVAVDANPSARLLEQTKDRTLRISARSSGGEFDQSDSP